MVARLSPGHPATLLALACLVAFFVHLYVGSQQPAGATLPMPIGLLAGALAAVALVEGALAARFDPHLPLVGNLIIITVVATTILARWWKPPLGATARDAAYSEPV